MILVYFEVLSLLVATVLVIINLYLDEYVKHDQVILSIVQNSLNHWAPVRTAVEPLGQSPLIVGAETEILK